MSNKTKTTLIIVAAVVVVVLLCITKFTGTYNNMVSLDENVSGAWAEVQNQYQRRYDLIPNLVATVQGYASHEKEVFAEVTEARSRAGGTVNIDADVLNNPEAFSRYQQVQDALGSSLQRLLVVSENYPALKADQNFLALQDQLEGTENRITVARGRFNDAARTYNQYVRRFPNSFIANMNGFETRSYFSAVSGAETAPKVQF